MTGSLPLSAGPPCAVLTPYALPHDLHELDSRQRHVVTRAQLAEVGIAAVDVECAVSCGRWSTWGSRLVLLRTGEPHPDQLRWMAVLHASDWTGGTAGLAAWTALEAAGLTGYSSPSVHVVVRRGIHVPVLPGVRVHESRRFLGADLHPSARPPRVTTERAAVDAAAWSESARRACAILAAVVQQRLSTAARLRPCLENAGQVRHRRVMLATLEDIAGGAHSLAELDVGRVCRAAALRPPARQRVRTDRQGRRRYMDCEWDLPDGRVVVLEVDGAQHMEAGHWVADMPRQRRATSWQRVVLRCAAVELRVAPRSVTDDLAAMGVPPR